MNPNESSRRNSRSDYENPFGEFEYGMNEFDRLNAEFDEITKAYHKLAKAYGELMDVEDFDEFDRKLEEFNGLMKRFDWRMEAGEGPVTKPHKEYDGRDGAKEAPGNRSWWTVTTETIVIPSSYLILMKKIREMETLFNESYDFF
jgi:hypothetical protein